MSVLAWLVTSVRASSLAEGALLGLLVWLGFIAAYIAPMYAFQAYSVKYLAIVIGYPLVALLIAGTILAIQ
jgi:uncharacterized membrane protein